MPPAPEPTPPRRAFTALAACGLFAAVFLAHTPLLRLGFYADDFGQLAEIHADLTAGRWPFLASARATTDEHGKIGIAIFRPALEATNAALMLVQGRDAAGRVRPPDPLGERLVSLSLRALLPALLFLLLLRLDFGDRSALLGAVFSAVNPAPYNAAAWIAARGDLLWVAAALAALLTAIPARGRPAASWRPTMVVIWVVLGLMAKETGMLCGLVAAIGLWVGARRGAFSRAAAATSVCGIVAALAGYVLLRRAIFGDAGSAYPGFEPDDPIGSVLRLGTRALGASGLRLVGGRGFDPDESAFAMAATFLSAAVCAVAIGYGLAAALRTPKLRTATIAAVLLGGISVAPILVQSALDIMASRLLVGWTIALGFVLAAGAARSPLGMKLGIAAILAGGAAFVAETDAGQALCAYMDEARASVVQAAAAAGSDATLLVHTPPRDVFPDPIVPDWGTTRSFYGVFLGLDRPVFQTPRREAFSSTSDPSSPNRPRTAVPGPLIVAEGGYDEVDLVLRYRCRIVPPLAGDLPSRIQGRTEPQGGASAELPPGAPARAYPVVALTIEPGPSSAAAADGVARILIEITGGTIPWKKTVEAPLAGDGPRTLTLWHDAFATMAQPGRTLDVSVRPEVEGQVVVTALSFAREGATLTALDPAPGAKWIAGTPPPRFAVRNRTGFPFVALVLTAKLDGVLVTREFVRSAATASGGAESAEDLAFAGDDGPGALFIAAGAALKDRPLLLHVRYEARARQDGPATAVAGVFDLLLAPN